MALTLAQSANLTNDELKIGVVQTMSTESKILAVLPFIDVEGHGYSYNVETALAGVEFRGVNSAYNTNAPQTERKTEYLSILGGEAVVDSFQMEVHSNVNDLMAVQTALTSKAVAHKYEYTFLNGDSAVDSNSFDGLIKRTASSAITSSGNIVDDIAVLLDEVKGGANAIIMNKATRRKLTAVAGNMISYTTNNFGVQVTNFGGVPILDVEAEILANDKIFAVKFGAHEGVAGLQSKSGVMVKPLGELGETPQIKTRIEWFCGMAVFSPKSVATVTFSA